MSKRRRSQLSMLTDRQIHEILESPDDGLDTDGEADEGSDFESDDDFFYDPDVEELFSESQPAAKRSKDESEAGPSTGPSAGPSSGSHLRIDPKSASFKNVQWRKGNLDVPESDLAFDDPELGQQFKELNTPYKCFSYFLDDDILDHIAAQSNLYAKQKDIGNKFTTTGLEIRRYLGMLTYMSVFRYPNLRSYWGEYAFLGIHNTMSRNRFEEIRRFLHFNDNSALPSKSSEKYDRLYKARPIIDHFNQKFQSVPLPQHVCVDEQMCATKMRSPIRQFLPNKPHKWGIKLFVLSDSHGFSYCFEVYCGAGDNVVFPGNPDLGAAANVVVRLSRVIPDFRNHILFFDNFYTTLALIVYLYLRGIYSLGTIRNNRIPNNKLPTDICLKKCDRGYSMEYVTKVQDVAVSVSVWKDNKPVRMASSFVGTEYASGSNQDSDTTVSRFVRASKQHINIPCPPMIKIYNRHMGGVDMADGLIGRYHIRLKTSKYTNRLFYHLVDLAMINAYVLFKRINNIDTRNLSYQLPNFRAEVAKAMCIYQAPGQPRPLGRPRIIVAKKAPIPTRTYLPPSDIRYDGVEHFPDHVEKKTCKNPGCSSETHVKCRKCNIHLCLQARHNCFYDFHHKS